MAMDWLLAICLSILCTSSRLALIRFTASMPFWKFALDSRMYRCDCSSVQVSSLHSSSRMLILLYHIAYMATWLSQILVYSCASTSSLFIPQYNDHH